MSAPRAARESAESRPSGGNDAPPVPEPGLDEVLTPQASARQQREGDPADHAGLFIAADNPSALSSGTEVVASLTVGKKRASVRPNQAGKFPVAYIAPGSSVDVSLRFPELEAGTPVSLAATAGGTLDGEVSLTRTLDRNGSLSFRFTAVESLGACPVRIRSGNDFKTLVFWAGPRAYGDASAVQASIQR